DRDRRGIDRTRKASRVQLERFDLAVAEHGGHRPAVHQLDALLEHVAGIIVTSCAPCRNASRAQSMAVFPPPMTATRGPSFTFDVPMPMSRRNGSPYSPPALFSPSAFTLFGSVRPTARTQASESF